MDSAAYIHSYLSLKFIYDIILISDCNDVTLEAGRTIIYYRGACNIIAMSAQYQQCDERQQ